jgi:hypothetical protein
MLHDLSLSRRHIFFLLQLSLTFLLYSFFLLSDTYKYYASMTGKTMADFVVYTQCVRVTWAITVARALEYRSLGSVCMHVWENLFCFLFNFHRVLVEEDGRVKGGNTRDPCDSGPEMLVYTFLRILAFRKNESNNIYFI